MNKDVIYIDVDDDVTAIIGKIKKSKEKIVALVPPKRAGALQSAVNLRLLDRMAKTEKKNLVIVTNNQALIALAANAKIPVAKNLQSKPEIAEIPALAVDDADDIIDGAELPVGDHAKSVKVKDGTRAATKTPEPSDLRSDAIDTVDIDGEEVAAAAPAAAVAAKKASSGSRVKIPNFDKFRKRLFLGVGGGVLLIVLLVWMFVFAPAATVVITAKTTPASVSSGVTLSEDGPTDFSKNTLKMVVQEEKKDETVEFEATGTGKVGDKSTGNVTFRNCDSSETVTVPAGTTLTADGRNYKLQSDTVVGAAGFSGGICTSPGSSSAVQLKAADVGSEYDQSGGTQFTVSGFSDAMRAIATSDGITGGSSREVKIVSDADVERARGQIIGKSTDDEKDALTAKFANGEKVIEGSFTVDRAKAVSTPAANEEASASGKATLTIETTYSLYAIVTAELENYLNESLKSQIDQNNQQIYSNGLDGATVSSFKKDGKKFTATVTATGEIGPKIDEAAIKESVKGKIYGEVQSSLQAIDGIQDVDVRFSFFWVRSVPNDTNKIHIEYKVENE